MGREADLAMSLSIARSLRGFHWGGLREQAGRESLIELVRIVEACAFFLRKQPRGGNEGGSNLANTP